VGWVLSELTPLPSWSIVGIATVSPSFQHCKFLAGIQALMNKMVFLKPSTNIHFPEGHMRTCEIMSDSGSRDYVLWMRDLGTRRGQHSQEGQGSCSGNLAPAHHPCHMREQKWVFLPTHPFRSLGQIREEGTTPPHLPRPASPPRLMCLPLLLLC
jgi:hypothetical protein